MSYEESYALSFQERMEAGRDAARANVERLAYAGARVTYKRMKLSGVLSVAETALLWGVSEQQVRKVLDRAGITGAKRSRKGKGRPWKIPYFLENGEIVVKVLPPARGREAAYAKRVPF